MKYLSRNRETMVRLRLAHFVGLLAIVVLIGGLAIQRAHGEDPITQPTPTQTLRGSPIVAAEQFAREPSSNAPVNLILITNIDQNSFYADNKAAAHQVKDGFLVLGFEKLASFRLAGFSSVPSAAGPQPNSKLSDQIPNDVKALDGSRLSVRGFMLPMKGAGGLCTEFLLLRNRSACCYGLMPQLNEWIVVVMAGKGVRPIMDQPISVSGKLHVGEVYKNERLVGVYQMEGEKMDGPNP